MKIKIISIDEMKSEMSEKEKKEILELKNEDGFFVSFNDGKEFHYMDKENDFWEVEHKIGEKK